MVVIYSATSHHVWPDPQLVLAHGAPDGGVGGEGAKLGCVPTGTS